MDTAARIKAIRESLGHSQRDMARALDCSLGALQSYEAGKSMPGGNVLEAYARMGFNVNWLLTGVGPRKLNEEEVKHLLCEEAHADLRKRLWERRNMVGAFIIQTPNLTVEDVESYAKGEKQLTKIQLIDLCKKLGSPFFDDEFIQLVTSVDFTTSEKVTEVIPEPIDEELLKLAIEVVEEIQYGDGPGLPSTKAALISLVYVMNSGTRYDKERLKRFLEAVCTLINQGIDIDKLSERKLNNLVIKIANHAVKGEN